MDHSSAGPQPNRFAPVAQAWLSGLGLVRDEVRQQLVQRQLAEHLPAAPPPLRVLDAGCGQGTQALALARLGHHVIGVDPDLELLATAEAAAAAEPAEVAARLRFVTGDLLALAAEHTAGYDVVCCHGVAMYLPSLTGTVAALVAAARPGGLVSLLTRNRAGIAMRAAMTGDWAGALAGFEARTYANRLGVEQARADEPAEVAAAFTAAGARPVAWYGVRLFTDHWDRVAPDESFPQLLAAEEQAGRRDPYRAVAALTHTLARLGPHWVRAATDAPPPLPRPARP